MQTFLFLIDYSGIMANGSSSKIKLIIFCVLAAGANYLCNTLCVYTFKIPLFLDTLFTVAVSFAAGLIPGLVTALLTYTAVGIRDGAFTPFIVCSIIEVLLVCRLKPVRSIWHKSFNPLHLIVSVFAGLILLYFTACITISVLGGVIDFFYYKLLSNPKLYFSPEDTFKMGLFRSGGHVLVMDILSRIPVNIVDRFIVIFGGYFISQGLDRFVSKEIQKEKSISV